MTDGRVDAMSDLTVLGWMVAGAIANAFLFVFIDKWVTINDDTIASGVIRGVRISPKHRRYVLQVRFVLNSATLVVIEGTLALAWRLVGENVSADDLRMLAHLVAFINAVGAVGWLVALPIRYRHFAAVMREAEAG